MSRIAILCVPLFLLSLNGAAVWAQAVSVVPLPQEVAPKPPERAFTVREGTVLVTAETTEGAEAALELLEGALKEKCGLAPARMRSSEFAKQAPAPPAIILGEPGKGNTALDETLARRGLALEPDYPGPEGYVLDVEPDAVLVAGHDKRGTLYGVATLVQLLSVLPGEKKPSVPAVRIVDWPDFPLRSVFGFGTSNMQPELLKRAGEIIRGVAALKFNMISLQNHNYQMLQREAKAAPGKKVHEAFRETWDLARRWLHSPLVEGWAWYFPNGSYSGGKRPSPEANDATTLEGIRYTQKMALKGEEEATFAITGKRGKSYPVANVLFDLATGKSWAREPVEVKSEDGKTTYDEGKDYAVKFGEIKSPFFKKCHDGDGAPEKTPRWAESDNPPTTVRRTKDSRIPDGGTVLVSYTYIGPDRWREGKFRPCLSDERLFTDNHPENYFYRWCTEPVKLLGATDFRLTVDEYRVLAWDERCRKSGKTRSDIFADLIKYHYQTIRKACPQARILMWSDMLDPNHNASEYDCPDVAKLLVQAGMADIVLCPWHSGVADKSLEFMASQGLNHILASAQGGGPDQDAFKWVYYLRKVFAGKPGLRGVQYTTWDETKGFAPEGWKAIRLVAQAAWSSGPYLIHLPVARAASGKELAISCQLEGDPLIYSETGASGDVVIDDGAGRGGKGKTIAGPRPVKTALVRYRRKGEQAWQELPLAKAAGEKGEVSWRAAIPAAAVAAPGLEYYLEASDGLQTRVSPRGAPKRSHAVKVE